jgi:hypothetical protein
MPAITRSVDIDLHISSTVDGVA